MPYVTVLKMRFFNIRVNESCTGTSSIKASYSFSYELPSKIRHALYMLRFSDIQEHLQLLNNNNLFVVDNHWVFATSYGCEEGN